MNFTTHNQHPINIVNTFGVGQIECTYQNLTATFGDPLKDGFDDYKTDAEWHVRFEDGTVASVYNWKNGFNYLGSAGTPVHAIMRWNIGGAGSHALERIKSAIMEKTNVQCTASAR